MLTVNWKKLRDFSLFIGVFFTILSQTPMLRERFQIDTQLISTPLWIIVLILSLLTTKKIYKKGITVPALFAVSFVLGILFLEIITDNNYIRSVMTTPIFISVMMILIGYLNPNIIEKNFFKKLSKAYIYAVILFCVDIYFSYFRVYDFSIIDYAFRAKNSAGQIILTALILLLYTYKPNSNYIKFLKIIFAILFIYVLVLMRSRASIISLLFIPLIYLMGRDIKRKYKVFCILAVIIAGTIIFMSEELFDLLIKNLLLNSTSNSSISQLDLNKITSNRYEYFSLFPRLIAGNLYTGIGSYYMDNFYFAAILNYGIIIGVLVISFALFPLKIAFGKTIRKLEYGIVFRTIAIIYIFNSFFECLAPFGPGTKCFFMWLLLGSILAIKKRSRNSKSLRGKAV